jgi:hypothetical protein
VTSELSPKGPVRIIGAKLVYREPPDALRLKTDQWFA